MAKIVDDEIVFNSGRRAYCFNGLFSCAEYDGKFGICYGSDGGLDWPDNDWQNNDQRLTNDDIREVAEMAIAQWRRLLATL